MPQDVFPLQMEIFPLHLCTYDSHVHFKTLGGYFWLWLYSLPGLA